MNSRGEWLDERKKGIGGSDCAAALGQSRYKTAFQLYQEKLGLIPGDLMVSPEAVERMEFGKRIEQVIADVYAQRYGVKLRRHNKLAKHARYPWMVASYDRTIDGQRVGFEAKNVSEMAYRLGDWGDEFSDSVPQEHLLQTHHYLSVSGYDAWVLAACVGGNSLRIFRIERDPEMIDLIEQGEAEFWQHVERVEPPALDYHHRSAMPLLKKLYPGSDGRTIHLPNEAQVAHYTRMELETLAKHIGRGAEAAKTYLLEQMGEASVGLLPYGGGYTRKVIERDGYEVAPTSYVDFRYSARKGEKQ
ncbi:YqaJ viral recombinase family protein [Paraburkholderia mimosarum]|uniref:YqaJ viral recombinase family nuclease n=1 Tax=Paraburkholderia mimosarum TaxID=312026 RepID=UPI0003FB5786|nr:YqaJ viral recombinase family protein [Paraburkholderia mimosarum]